MRQKGYSIINKVLHSSQTMTEAVKYSVMTGLLGVSIAECPPPLIMKPTVPLDPPLQGIGSVIPYTKYMILLERATLMEFVINELKSKVLEGEQYEMSVPIKTSANFGAHSLLTKPSRSR